MRALVLGGGGSRGAWQAGAIQHLLGVERRQYDLVCGVSVGALNGAFIAQYPHGQEVDAASGLKHLWQDIRGERDIYVPWFDLGTAGTLISLMAGELGLYDSSPLWRLVDRSLDRDRLLSSGKMFRAGMVELGTWRYRSVGESEDDIVQAVKASSAFPVYFRPVRIGGALWIDGGVKEVTPLSEAIALGATSVDVIVCHREDESVVGHSGQYSMKHLLAGLMGSFLSEIGRRDFWAARLHNRLVRAGADSGKRFVDVRVLRPSNPLWDSLSFSPLTLRRGFNLGAMDASLEESWEDLI